MAASDKQPQGIRKVHIISGLLVAKQWSELVIVEALRLPFPWDVVFWDNQRKFLKEFKGQDYEIIYIINDDALRIENWISWKYNTLPEKCTSLIGQWTFPQSNFTYEVNTKPCDSTDPNYHRQAPQTGRSESPFQTVPPSCKRSLPSNKKGKNQFQPHPLKTPRTQWNNEGFNPEKYGWNKP